MRASAVTALLLVARGSAAKNADELEVLAKVRTSLAQNLEGIPPEATLSEAISTLQKAEVASKIRAQEKLLARPRHGYQRLNELLAMPPANMKKLKTAVSRAQKKLDAAQAEVNDDEELMSKAEKAERQAALDKAQKAKDTADANLKAAEDAEAIKSPSKPVLMPALKDVIAKLQAAAASSSPSSSSSIKVQVLSESPMVAIVDDWLTDAGLQALGMLPPAIGKVLSGDALDDVGGKTDGEGGGPPPPKLPTKRAELQKEGYTPDGATNQHPTLCLPIDDEETDEAKAVSPVMLSAIDSHIAIARAAAKKARTKPKKKEGDESADAGSGYCDATAGLTDEQPEDWDADEDGEWKGEVMTASDRYRFATAGCGPLTPALDKEFVNVDSVFYTTSAELSVDVLDLAISRAAGFAIDDEAIGARFINGSVARRDPNATQPDDWDEAEDGVWEAPMLPAKDATALYAEVISEGGAAAAAIGDAYSFSSSPQVVRYRVAAKGREDADFHCTDFSRLDKSTPQVAFLAELYANDNNNHKNKGGGGGATTFPALGLSVEPKVGRLVLYETILPDGSCDPAAALVGRSPIESKNGGGKGEAQDVMVIRKRFYADRSFSRANVNGEGPGRGMPTARCEADTQVGGKSSNNNKGGKPPPAGSLAICTRHEHVGAPRGDAVLPLREVAGTRGCLPPNSNGACPAPDGYVAPPPPQKKKKPRTPPSTPPAEQEAVNAPPAAPKEPGAPPPIPR